MNQQQARYLAQEARRLSEDETLQAALDHARDRALEALAKCDLSDVNQAVRLQARVLAIDELQQSLGEMIINAPRDRTPVR